MRKPHLLASIVVVLGVGTIAVASGCADLSTDSASATVQNPGDPNTGENGTVVNGTDAAAVPLTPRRGSPLCNVTNDLCMPDDGVCGGTATVDAGFLTGELDGGPARADGCRITRADGDYVPQCFGDGGSNRYGVDGVACKQGSDCAPGYDCIDGDKGSVCRRYCCSGSCDDHLSQNGGRTFCDVQKLVDANPHKAPVCMPLKKCKLLVPGACADKETCAIVTDKGDTGCVANGNAKAGDSCDEEQCGAGLTCLGSPGDRRCYTLCRTDGDGCGATQKCTTGSVFLDTTYGVCKDL